jgi:hypothetical protein
LATALPNLPTLRRRRTCPPMDCPVHGSGDPTLPRSPQIAAASRGCRRNRRRPSRKLLTICVPSNSVKSNASASSRRAKAFRALDVRAGPWIFNAARTNRVFSGFAEPSPETRRLVHGLQWKDFADIESVCERIAQSDPKLDPAQRARCLRSS